MSRYVTVKTQLRDMGLLRRTLQDMGLGVIEGAGAARLPGGHKADLVVQGPAGPVGFAQGEGQEIAVVGMEERVRGKTATAFLNQVTQRYARHKVMAEAERAGYRLVEETVESDSTIRLVVRRW